MKSTFEVVSRTRLNKNDSIPKRVQNAKNSRTRGRMEQGKTLSKRRRSTLLRGSVWDCFLSKVNFFREIVKWPHVCNIFYLQLCHNLKIKGVVGRSTFSLCFTFFEVKAVKQNYAMYSILTSKCSEK